jgi:RHS repeat-associated protein
MRTGSTTLNFLLGDHLGSNAITTNSSGVKISEIRYMPWGTTRYTSGTSPTTMQYTGQRVEASFGLLFYNARWYDPLLGRFTSPDTIVPGGVQGLDRYAYVSNNPLRYTDPSGHQICDADGYCGSNPSAEQVLHQFGVTLSGIWSDRDKLVALNAVTYTAIALGNAARGTAISTFRSTYGGVNLTMGIQGADDYCTQNMGSAGGCTSNTHQINFASLQQETISGGGIVPENIAFMSASNNVVHELGHAFADRWYQTDGNYDPTGPLGPGKIDNNLTVDEKGFAPAPEPYSEAIYMWRQHPYDYSASEIFADMFLGWTYNTWASDSNGRGDFMNQSMPNWLN